MYYLLQCPKCRDYMIKQTNNDIRKFRLSCVYCGYKTRLYDNTNKMFIVDILQQSEDVRFIMNIQKEVKNKDGSGRLF